jgi:hypothetical protein
MMFVTVALEVYGMSCKTESFWGADECQYSPQASSTVSRTESRTDVATQDAADEDAGEKAEKPDETLNYLAST